MGITFKKADGNTVTFEKYNHNHAADGKFTSKGGGTAASSGGVKYRDWGDFPNSVKHKGKKYNTLGVYGQADLVSGGKAQRYENDEGDLIYMDEKGNFLEG